MTSFHYTVGLIIVILYLVLVVAGFLRLRGERDFPWMRGVAFAASGLLLLQYVLGFALLAEHSISAIHYVVALAAVIPVGAEHMMASSPSTAQEEKVSVDNRQAKLSLVASFATLVLVLVAFALGESAG